MRALLVRLAAAAAVALLAGTATAPVSQAFGSSTAPGDQLWAARYVGVSFSPDRPEAVAMSPDGSRVFVTGVTGVESTGWDYGTVAYDASNGSQLWTAEFDGGSIDEARALAVSPDGSKVFVTGGTRALNGYTAMARSRTTPRRGRSYGPGSSTVPSTGETGDERWP
jgi:outer membrane protein assembly factor BamB